MLGGLFSQLGVLQLGAIAEPDGPDPIGAIIQVRPDVGTIQVRPSARTGEISG